MSDVLTPLDWQEWESAVADHPDQKFKEYVVNGIRHGFRVGFDYATASCPSSVKNLPSVRDNHKWSEIIWLKNMPMEGS